MSGKKRERDPDDSLSDLTVTTTGSPGGSASSTTNFRNVSACNRCRNRKNRCDQRLPRCTNCEKVGVKCIGFDPVSKRAIPRNYVYYLETRVNNLEALLGGNGIPCPPPSDDFAISDAIMPSVPFPPQEAQVKIAEESPEKTSALDPALQDVDNQGRGANHTGMVPIQSATDPRQSAHANAIPFSRVVYAAVKSSVTPTPSERGTTRPTSQLPSSTASGGGGSDSFFGLNTKPTVKAAPFPERQIGERLVELYFEHANPQIPILHRGGFMNLVERVYATEPKNRRSRELYLLNIVFAIGSGIIMDSTNVEQTVAATESKADDASTLPNRKRPRLANQQFQPEEYHSAAITHLDSFLGSTPAAEGSSGGLEELQAVLLLAGLALLRPVAPGLWYIIGVAVRLAVDLGLHSEELDVELDSSIVQADQGEPMPPGVNRRQWARDLRRRLWWCTYSFDRLVSTCVGRPFGISDQVVTTEFPSLLDDKHITITGFLKPSSTIELPTYKLVAHHYFRLRLLQSEILQVLQHRQAEQIRASGANRHNEFMHTALPSPFVIPFNSFRDWRMDVDLRLTKWKDSAPDQSSTGVAFTPLFLELNYWQAVIMLYRQSLTVPEPLAGELSPSTGGEVQSPGAASLEPREDEEMVYMKVAQAGQTVLKIYRQLHRLKLVNYTFLATHHLFMSGISFLYAIWHSTLVRSQLTLDDVDFTVLVATSVLTDLMDKCPPAEACRDAFTRMSKATISMVMSTTGFGDASILASQPLNSPGGYFRSLSLTQSNVETQAAQHERVLRRAALPQFDMHLRDLFSDDELANRPPMYQPKRQSFGNARLFTQAPDAHSLPALKTETNTFSIVSPQGSSSEPSHYRAPAKHPPSLSYQVSNQQPYQPFAETISKAQTDFSFDDLSFLDSFPVADPSNAWAGANDLDLGFGTGGNGFDGHGAWEAKGGVDLFDGFWFGPQ
ncbi:hypothetical protein LTR53_010781 [Teratosphaeriaceae sp. CCFEE 6253]|nr:hypothetical protein LTR53_010781 [Teratosphaeriaceae sp. CCFEE 6253]